MRKRGGNHVLPSNFELAEKGLLRNEGENIDRFA